MSHGPWRQSRQLLLIVVISALLIGCGKTAKEDWSERFTHLWQGYQKQFVNTQGRVIDPAYPDHRTTSEGQAYALFFALVANDPQRFEQIRSWTQQNLAKGDLGTHLPAWLWGLNPDNHQWGVLDTNTASDADLWIAYALLEAGRLWHKPTYVQTGQKMASLIAQMEVLNVAGLGTVLLPGLEGFGPDAQGCVMINPSYTPLPVVRLMAHKFGAPWQSIADGLPHLIKASAPHGFPADWVQACPEKGVIIPAAAHPPIGSYDAIRVYLWAGITAPNTPGSEPLLKGIWGMANYLSGHTIPPEHVDVLKGSASSDGPVGFSAALLPYLNAQKMQTRFNRLAALVQADQQPSGLLGAKPTYYDQNLGLFALGYLAGLYQFNEHGTLEVPWQ